ncbi:DUF2294 domain-containing protein [Alicyclobacillus herbarius]|uniref:DUF2294 domain-containing protein n=1 Tax=Alicyclobacillus herbarius TaxID=122960 RepID=UPI00047B7203|nr:DUF2294 domain-containing protein [Alicyclobacillus herbarius]
MDVTRVVHEFNNVVREVRKKHTGKGPEKITTRFLGAWAICEMKGTLTGMEKFVAQTTEGRRMVHELRTTFVKEIYKNEAVRKEVEQTVGAKLVKLYCDFDVESDTAMTVYVFDRPLGLDTISHP